MKYLVVDGELSGTGIRDAVEGGYIELDDLGLSDDLAHRIRDWQSRYELCHFSGYRDPLVVEALDKEGKEIAHAVQTFLPESKVDYYSDAFCKRFYLSVLRKE